MDAYLDYVSGASYGSEVGSPSNVGGDQTVAANGGGYFSGLLQTMTTLGTGYLARRVDIDLQRRLSGSQPVVSLPTTQQGIGVQRANPPQPGGISALAGGNRGGGMFGMPPWMLWAGVAGVGVVVYMLARRG
jgi:hypothetical protein